MAHQRPCGDEGGDNGGGMTTKATIPSMVIAIAYNNRRILFTTIHKKRFQLTSFVFGSTHLRTRTTFLGKHFPPKQIEY